MFVLFVCGRTKAEDPVHRKIYLFVLSPKKANVAIQDISVFKLETNTGVVPLSLVLNLVPEDKL